MSYKIAKSRNYKKYKVFYQTKINLNNNSYIQSKLTRKKWHFLRFANQFHYFPRVRKLSKLKFFCTNRLNLRRILKQKICLIKTYDLLKLYNNASKGNPRYLNFINLLESRLDVCLFRTGLFVSPVSLRQFILHKNIYLNGRVINKPGVLLQKNDLVQINFIHLNFSDYDKALNLSFDHLSHLEVDLKTCSFIYLGPFSLSNFCFKKAKDLSFLNYIFNF
jgi:ribosomal protein S4